VAKKGGDLPAFGDLEAIRREHRVPVRRFCLRLGIPRSTWYHWRAGQIDGRPVRRWPAPVVDAIVERTAEEAHRYAAWGHRKIWAMLRADGIRVSASSIERAMRRRDLLQPRRYQAERRHLAARRKATFRMVPTRRNRVWQADFTEFETSAGGTWRLGIVVDYVTKVCLAVAILGRTAAQDAIDMLRTAIEEAERLCDRPLLDECLDPATGELQRLVVVTDNGPAFKSLGFARFIADRLELDHVRTRHYAPATNGVVERFNQSLKYEHLYRLQINDVLELDAACEEYRRFYNDTRPHEALDFAVPLMRYLAEPPWPPQEPNLSEAESVQIS
jgi:transposase InsO family protein